MAENYGMQAIQKSIKIKYLIRPSHCRIIGLQASLILKFHTQKVTSQWCSNGRWFPSTHNGEYLVFKIHLEPLSHAPCQSSILHGLSSMKPSFPKFFMPFTPIQGDKSHTLKVEQPIKSFHIRSLQALSLIFWTTWYVPSPLGRSLDFLWEGNRSFLR